MGKLAYDLARLSSFQSLDEYNMRAQLRTAEGRARYIAENARQFPESATTVGFKVRQYRSGEVTGAQYRTGRQGKVIPPCRSGEVVTNGFTVAAQVKIRRSVECSDTFLGKFVTLTFAPASLQPWHLDDRGNVRHDYAKWKLKKFLDACSVKQRRLGRVLNYLWVAELQENGNIHFHILWDKFFDIKWLTKIWAQATNSVDIKRMNDPLHAARYMRKYMTKDESSEIRGNRYNISAGLRESMKPIEKILVEMTGEQLQEQPWLPDHLGEFRGTLQALKEDIHSRGGRILDFGFSAPMGRSSKEYKDKKTGEKKRSRGVDPRLGKQLISILSAQAQEIQAQIVPF